MRVLVGWVLIWSGWSHVTDPVTRGKSIGMSPGFTRFLGLVELAGGLGVRSASCCSSPRWGSS
jgi:putative oxidoreductase